MTSLAAVLVSPKVATAEPKFAFTANGDGGRMGCVVSTTPCPRGQETYTEGGKISAIEEQDDTTRHRRDLVTAGSPSPAFGTKMLIFDGYSSDVRRDPSLDRVELNLSYSGESEDTVLQFGETRYLRFSLKLHPNFGHDGFSASAPACEGVAARDRTPAQRDVLITQVWQRSSNDYGARKSRGPAFAINAVNPPRYAKDADNVWLQFFYSNDCDYEAWPCPATMPGRVFLTESVKRGEWVSFIIMLKPQYAASLPQNNNARGAILVWRMTPDQSLLLPPNDISQILKDEKARNYSATDDTRYKFFWGYRPETAFTAENQQGLTDRFDVRVGIYRNESDPLVTCMAPTCTTPPSNACTTPYGSPFPCPNIPLESSPCMPALMNNTLFMDGVKLTNFPACLPGTGGCP